VTLYINKDSLDEKKGFNSVVFWRLQITNPPDFIGEKTYFDLISLSPKWEWTYNAIPTSFKYDTLSNTYEALFTAQSKGRRYNLEKLHIESVTSKNSYSSSYEFIIILFNKVFTVEPGTLNNLGVFKVKINWNETSKKFSYITGHTQDEFIIDQTVFKDKYPGLVEKFNSKFIQPHIQDTTVN
jgi:hypothetical protein